MLETKKFVLTVEGETEMWYFLWLKDQINQCEIEIIMFQLFLKFNKVREVSTKELMRK